ncbi:stage VI sporulation protein F [Bacillus sp. YZJH907-2]|uniref:Stage VI sporulation protein F n=2 Tax=Halalkalibacter suaedae TaxID=2822140 RepID=A0A941APM7_9BACI|nr:stage VI sporulation protein F [Bacillus suaedae]
MDMFNGIEKKTGVKFEDILKLTDSVKGVNFQDEQSVRQLIDKVAKLANKPVSPEMSNSIVDMLVNKKQKIDEKTISQLLNNKK